MSTTEKLRRIETLISLTDLNADLASATWAMPAKFSIVWEIKDSAKRAEVK